MAAAEVFVRFESLSSGGTRGFIPPEGSAGVCVGQLGHDAIRRSHVTEALIGFQSSGLRFQIHADRCMHWPTSPEP